MTRSSGSRGVCQPETHRSPGGVETTFEICCTVHLCRQEAGCEIEERGTEMTARWYAMRSKPRKEESLWRQLRAREVEVFYPRIKVQPVNPRARKVRPYFPGYLFIRADLEETGLSTFRWMPFSVGLVTFGGEPAHVPDSLIHAIRRRVEEINAAGGELFDGLKKGDVVKIKEGPFEGYEAIFDARLDGAERVRVLLKFLSDRNVPVELRASQIERQRERRQERRRQERRRGRKKKRR